MPELNDNSLMPFGKFKDKRMADVPASYLLWLYEQNKKHARNKLTLGQLGVRTYIEDNLEVLQKEVKEQNQHKRSND